MKLKLLIFATISMVAGQNGQPTRVPIRFCDPGNGQFSCADLLRNLESDPVLERGGMKFASEEESGVVYFGVLQCVRAHSTLECLTLIAEGSADLMRLPAEGLFGLSESRSFPNLIPIAAGLTAETSCLSSHEECHQFAREYSVAVIRQNSEIRELAQLRDKRACFGEVGSSGGWTIPIYKLLSNWTGNDPFNPIITKKLRSSPQMVFSDRKKRQIFTNVTRGSGRNSNSGVWEASNIMRCPVDLSVASDVFPGACAPGSWPADSGFASAFSNRLCSGCLGLNNSCSAAVSSNDAMECLRSGKGEVAFLSSKEIEAFVAANGDGSDLNFAALCPMGRREVLGYPYCHWGVIPEDVYITQQSPAQFGPSIYAQYLRSLYANARGRITHYTALSFLADSRIVAEIKRLDQIRGSHQGTFLTAKQYLQLEGKKNVFYEAMDKGFPECPNRDTMRLCVMSREEQQKCQLMQIAFRGAGLPESLECVVGYSPENCVRMINSSQADLSWIDSHLADHFGHSGKVRPIMEASSDGDGVDYAVAVSLASGSVQKLKDLGLIIASTHVSVCSAGTDSFAGWEAPNNAFKNLGLVARSQCRLSETWATMFRSSCVPGATNATVTLGRNASSPINAQEVQDLCQSCGGASESTGRCLTPAQASDAAHQQYDPYYGDVGALRCLVRRKGQVAFIRSSAIRTMIALREEFNDQDFRAIQLSDLHLLCPDGSSMRPYSRSVVETCNLGRVPRKWLVSRSNADAQQLIRWQDLWIAASNRARKDFDWMQTNIRLTPGRTDHLQDLIFANASSNLERFPVSNASDTYFHNLIYENWRSPFECSSAAQKITPMILLLTALFLQFFR